MNRLKANEKAQYRTEQLKKQDGICPLCEREIPSGQDTLDHDHSSGRVRMVLCRNCNSIEGRVLHWVRRTGVEIERWLANIAWFWNQDYDDNPQYPTHKTELERRILLLRKQMRRVKKKSTKAKYKSKIDKLTKELRSNE